MRITAGAIGVAMVLDCALNRIPSLGCTTCDSLHENEVAFAGDESVKYVVESFLGPENLLAAPPREEELIAVLLY